MLLFSSCVNIKVSYKHADCVRSVVGYYTALLLRLLLLLNGA